MTKNTFGRILAILLVLTWVTGCAMKQKKIERSVTSGAPIDCTTADGDVRMLEHEKAHVAQRIAEGVTSIYPAGLVIGLVTGTEGTKLKVATGEYNKKIDARIAEIKSTCGI
jgi:hypothetical protein